MFAARVMAAVVISGTSRGLSAAQNTTPFFPDHQRHYGPFAAGGELSRRASGF